MLYHFAKSRFYQQVNCMTCPIDDAEGKSDPKKTYIALLHIQADIEYRFSRTQVTSVMINPSNTAEEVTFSIYLPSTAFISDFSM